MHTLYLWEGIMHQQHRVHPLRTTRIGLALATALALTAAAPAFATDGYFSHGNGMKAKGRGGTSIAMTGDAFGGANNPATMVRSGNRIEAGVDFFMPKRAASRSGLGPGLDGSVESDKNFFPVPEFGYNHMLSDDLSLGVSVYGNGGMNTDYEGGQFNCGFGPANMLCGSGRLGVDLSQLVIAPTLSFAINERHSIGVSPLIAAQRFKAEGLHAFSMISQDPTSLTNRGYDTTYGFGLRVGYFGQLNDKVSVGLTYASKINMGRFDKYQGLFAGNGDFDIPENFGAGIAVKPADGITIAVDYNRINYGKLRSIGNQSLVPFPLGNAAGPGFGWSDIDVVKLGVEYAANERLVLRGGYNHSKNPISGSNVTFNILAPGVVTDHATLGMTYTTDSGNEVTVAYMHAFKKSVTGASILPAFLGGMPAGLEEISMYQNSIGIQYSWK
jgi:long-chain fatty acid transport protein